MWPSDRLEDDWSTFCALFQAVIGTQPPATGEYSDALCGFCAAHGISTPGVQDAEGLKAIPPEQYHKLVQDLVWALVQKYEVAAAADPSQPSHIRESMGSSVLKDWAAKAVKTVGPYCEVGCMRNVLHNVLVRRVSSAGLGTCR